MAEVPFEEISLKREAATRRLQTVWEDIIHRYSQYGGEEDSDGGDVIDLETGTILVDHGHLRGLARTTGAVWGVPAAPRETVFRGVADLDEEDDETQADHDKDDGDDDGDNDDLMGSWNQEPPSNDVSESDGDETSRQLSKNVRTLTTKLRTAPQDDQFHLALDYDALLLPPVSSSPVSTFSRHHRVEKDIGSDSDEQRFLQQFQHGERTSSSSSSSHFFFAADRDAARLRSLFTFRNGATTGPI